MWSLIIAANQPAVGYNILKSSQVILAWSFHFCLIHRSWKVQHATLYWKKANDQAEPFLSASLAGTLGKTCQTCETAVIFLLRFWWRQNTQYEGHLGNELNLTYKWESTSIGRNWQYLERLWNPKESDCTVEPQVGIMRARLSGRHLRQTAFLFQVLPTDLAALKCRPVWCFCHCVFSTQCKALE